MQPASTSAQALQQYQAAANSAQDPNAIQQQQNQQYGVGAAQQTVQGLQGAIQNTTSLLNQVAPSVMGRTANSLVTDAQSGKIIQNEQAPISAKLTSEGSDLTNANSALNSDQSQAENGAKLAYQGQQDKLSYLQNIYNTLYNQEQNAQAETDKQKAAAVTAAKSTGTKSTTGSSSGYTQSQDASGGGSHFYGPGGTAITAAQYFDATGGGINGLSGFLKSDPNSAAAYNDLASGKYTYSQLEQKYPYIFEGG